MVRFSEGIHDSEKEFMKKINYSVHVTLNVVNLRTGQSFEAGIIYGQYDTSRNYDSMDSAKENSKLSLKRWLERFPTHGGWVSYRRDDSRYQNYFSPKYYSVEVVRIDEPKLNSFEWLSI